MTHRYKIVALSPAAHLFRVELTVDHPDPEGQRLALPAWIPGSYVVRDYARHVVAIRAESGGVDVPLDKVDKSTWQAVPVTRELTVTADIYAYDDSVRGAHLDTTHAYFNGVCVFLKVIGQEHEPCTLDVEMPDLKAAQHWRVATAMHRDGAEPYGFGRYVAGSYAELIDHPFEIGELTIGEFDAGGIPHAIAIRGRVRCDMSRLCHDLKALCEQQLGFLGAPEDLDRYLFLLHAPDSGYGGLEHGWSSSLVCNRDYLPFKGQAEVDEGYRTFLGLASHEYFHLWSVKRIQPATIASSALAEETYTRLLWVFEGITSYYDDLMLLRSGLIEVSDYFELLGRTITRVWRGPGRLRQSVSDSSFDAWIKFYKQDANAVNSIVSYYAKGALIALCLDLKLRLDSGGSATLDDVMHAAWERFGPGTDGVPEDGFEALCEQVSGLPLGDFFDAAVRGTGELPLEKLLRSHAVELRARVPNSRDDKGGTPPNADKAPAVAFGATLAQNGGNVIFQSVVNDGPAERAGVAPGDQPVAIDGLRLTANNIDRRLRAYRHGDRAKLVVFRGDELLTLDIRFKSAPEDTAYLVPLGDADGDAIERRDTWLTGN